LHNFLGLNKYNTSVLVTGGAGGQTNLLQLIEVLKKVLVVDIEPIFGPNRPGDIPHSNADITKA
jgi:UDP-glucose 4-epimerase